MFAKDVSKYCKTTTASPAECKRDLLAFGVNKLEKMTETHLDAMDPYQRSANDISKYTHMFITCCYVYENAIIENREPKTEKDRMCFEP